MSFISKCLQAKVQAGLLDAAQVKHIEDTLKSAGPGQAEAELAKALHEDLSSTLDHSIRTAYNHLNNLAEVDKIAATGSIHLAKERFLDRPVFAADANVNLLSQYVGRILDDWRPTILRNPNATRASELEILNSLHGAPGQSAKSIAAADSIRKLNAHRAQMLQDAGVKLASNDIRADRVRPAVLPQNVIKFNPEELDRLVSATVDGEAFNNIMAPALKAFKGDRSAMFEGIRKVFGSGFIEGLPIRPQVLKELFNAALVPQNPAAFFKLSDQLGSKSLVGDLLLSIQADAKRAARTSLLGDSKIQADQLANRLVSQLAKAGKHSPQDLQNLQNSLSSSIKYGFGELDRYSLDSPIFKTLEAAFSDAKSLASAVFIPGVTPSNWFSDIAVREAAQRQYGLGSAGIVDLLANMVKNRSNKNAMMEAGVLGHVMVEEALERYKIGTSLFGNNFSAQFASKAIRMSGLYLETNAQRMSATKLALAKLSSALHETEYGQLDSGIKKLLNRANIFDAEWETLRAASNRGDHSVLDIIKLAESGNAAERKLAAKVDEALLHFMNAAVPTKSPATAKTRAQMHSIGAAAGAGFEALSTFMSYPAVFWKEHVMRPLEIGKSYGLKYAAATMAMSTLGLYIGFQARNAMNGKMPSATDSGSWSYASLSSAGLGGAVLQELLGNSYGGSNIAGAVGSVPLGAVNAVVTNIQRAISGQETQFAWDGIKSVWSAIPRNAGVRLLLERLVFDNLQKMFDPHAHANIRRKIARQKERGGYWWEPGSDKPNFLD